MIFHVEKDSNTFLDMNAYLKEQTDNSYASRIKALWLGYAAYPRLCEFWQQKNKQGELTAVISRCGGQCIIDIRKNADIDELSAFFRQIFYTTILCSAQQELRAEGKCFYGSVMLFSFNSNIEKSKIEIANSINIKEYYNLLKLYESQSFPIPEFSGFYVDLNHKCRKQTAKLFGILKENELVSACCAPAIESSSSIISGVVTLPECQGRGFARACVLHAANFFAGGQKRVFLHISNPSLHSFYKSVGFNTVGKWKEIHN